MGVCYVLTDPLPEFLDVVEPRRGGGQKQCLSAGLSFEDFANPLLVMSWPVVHHHVDLFRRWVHRAYVGEAAGHPLGSNPMKVPHVYSFCNSVHQTNHPHNGVGAAVIRHLGLTTPHSCPQQSLSWLTIEAGLVGEQYTHLVRILAGFSESLVQGPFFSWYRGSGECMYG